MRDPYGLLQAILDDPADDLPRLAYADWLEETGTGPAWAYHVRHGRESVTVAAGQTMLLGQDGGPGVILTCPVASGYAVWRRGFVAGVRTTLAEWGRRGPELVRRHPVEKVGLTDRRAWTVSGSTHLWWREPHHRPVASWPGMEGDVRHLLPGSVWDLLDLPAEEAIWPSYKAADTAGDADAALSRALLTWARLQAMRL